MSAREARDPRYANHHQSHQQGSDDADGQRDRCHQVGLWGPVIGDPVAYPRDEQVDGVSASVELGIVRRDADVVIVGPASRIRTGGQRVVKAWVLEAVFWHELTRMLGAGND